VTAKLDFTERGHRRTVARERPWLWLAWRHRNCALVSRRLAIGVMARGGRTRSDGFEAMRKGIGPTSEYIRLKKKSKEFGLSHRMMAFYMVSIFGLRSI
jgi:hypothetical protein